MVLQTDAKSIKKKLPDENIKYSFDPEALEYRFSQFLMEVNSNISTHQNYILSLK